MNFDLDCECGQSVTVSEAAAEGTALCICGRSIAVPPLKEMRLQAGLPAYNLSPEMVIEHLLPAGRLPGSTSCARCGEETKDAIHVLTECERSWTTKSGEFSWSTLIVTSLFLPVSIFHWRRVEKKRYGRDKVYSLPLPICEDCKPAVRGRKRIKQYLQRIPEYCRLLDKFPDARVTLD
jgi:hypothetical protein